MNYSLVLLGFLFVCLLLLIRDTGLLTDVLRTQPVFVQRLPDLNNELLACAVGFFVYLFVVVSPWYHSIHGHSSLLLFKVFQILTMNYLFGLLVVVCCCCCCCFLGGSYSSTWRKGEKKKRKKEYDLPYFVQQRTREDSRWLISIQTNQTTALSHITRLQTTWTYRLIRVIRAICPPLRTWLNRAGWSSQPAVSPSIISQSGSNYFDVSLCRMFTTCTQHGPVGAWSQLPCTQHGPVGAWSQLPVA